MMFRMKKLISQLKSKDQHMEVSSIPNKLNIKTAKLYNCRKKKYFSYIKLRRKVSNACTNFPIETK